MAIQDKVDPVKSNNHTPVIFRVVTDFINRMSQGVKKYGTALQPHNGRSALKDAYEQFADKTGLIRIELPHMWEHGIGIEEPRFTPHGRKSVIWVNKSALALLGHFLLTQVNEYRTSRLPVGSFSYEKVRFIIECECVEHLGTTNHEIVAAIDAE